MRVLISFITMSYYITINSHNNMDIRPCKFYYYVILYSYKLDFDIEIVSSRFITVSYYIATKLCCEIIQLLKIVVLLLCHIIKLSLHIFYKQISFITMLYYIAIKLNQLNNCEGKGFITMLYYIAIKHQIYPQ